MSAAFVEISNRRTFLTRAGLGAMAVAAGCVPDAKSPAESGGDSAGTDSGADTAGDSGGGDTGPPTDGWAEVPTDCATATNGTGTGPFYREGAPLRTDLNVLDEEGDAIRIFFRVVDEQCNPVANAFCEVWHCAPEAQYDMTSDDMRFYGTQYTDAEGKGWFQTIKPPVYVDDAGEHINHIHIQITATGFPILAFQVQFYEDGVVDGPLNELTELTEASDGFREGAITVILAAEATSG